MTQFDNLFERELHESEKVVKEKLDEEKRKAGEKLSEYAAKRLGALEEKVTEEFNRKEPTIKGMMGDTNNA